MTMVDAPPTGRTELDVAADTVAALIAAQVVHVGSIRVAAEAAGLMQPEVQHALERRRQRGFIPPRRTQCGTPPTSVEDRAAENPPSPEPSPSAAAAPPPPPPAGRHYNTGRVPHNKTPEGPTRTCIKCEKDKPIGEFLQRTDSNSRRTECDTCRLAISRSRYLTVDERQRLTLILEQGDSIIGLPCPKCQRAFAAGDAVETVSLEGLIHHHDCGIETPTGDSQ